MANDTFLKHLRAITVEANRGQCNNRIELKLSDDAMKMIDNYFLESPCVQSVKIEDAGPKRLSYAGFTFMVSSTAEKDLIAIDSFGKTIYSEDMYPIIR